MEDIEVNTLVVTHGGFIMEFMNVFKKLINKNHKDIYANDSRNTSITQYLIYYDKGEIKFQLGPIQNDNQHLGKNVH